MVIGKPYRSFKKLAHFHIFSFSPSFLTNRITALLFSVLASAGHFILPAIHLPPGREMITRKTD
jgi:hypothetical protein